MTRPYGILAIAVALWLGTAVPAPARTEPEAALVAGGRALPHGTVMHRAAPSDAWTLSITVRLGRGSRIALHGPAWSVALRRPAHGYATLHIDGQSISLAPRRGWPGDGRHHIELASRSPAALAVDGRRVQAPTVSGSAIRLSSRGDGVRLESLIVAPATRPAALLLHRLASLHARTPAGRFPLGADAADRLHFQSGWTSGFWPGALWHAAALAPGDGLFERWAMQATLARLGNERADTHDLGFMYGHSSARAHDSLCPAPIPPARQRLCARLRRSAIRAADALVDMAATNKAAQMIPTRSSGRHADVIIDSVMNLALLAWASAATGRPGYAALAHRHAHTVAEHLVRPDGSTAQSLHVRRTDGTLLRLHTHQGLDAASTWARGQSWALYGFAEIGQALGDPQLARISERAARFVATRLPTSGAPPWDYDAAAGAPRDVSAGVIAAAGLFRLAAACRALPTACLEPDRWGPLADRLISASLHHARPRPPLGRLAPQVYTLGGRASWDDRAELIFGLDYALEAVRAQEPRSPAIPGAPNTMTADP